jgi:2-hydroxy-3-keto-5-methylthiopentenyl-1-phosphate phosphatase
MYCYNDDKGIDMTLKAISLDPLIKDDFVIVGIHNPGPQVLQGGIMPVIQGFFQTSTGQQKVDKEEDTDPSAMKMWRM